MAFGFMMNAFYILIGTICIGVVVIVAYVVIIWIIGAIKGGKNEKR